MERIEKEDLKKIIEKNELEIKNQDLKKEIMQDKELANYIMLRKKTKEVMKKIEELTEKLENLTQNILNNEYENSLEEVAKYFDNNQNNTDDNLSNLEQILNFLQKKEIEINQLKKEMQKFNEELDKNLTEKQNSEKDFILKKSELKNSNQQDKYKEIVERKKEINNQILEIDKYLSDNAKDIYENTKNQIFKINNKKTITKFIIGIDKNKDNEANFCICKQNQEQDKKKIIKDLEDYGITNCPWCNRIIYYKDYIK